MENLISRHFGPSIRKTSVSLKSLLCGIKLLTMIVQTSVFVEILIKPNCFRPGVQWIQLITDINEDQLREGSLKQIVVVIRDEGE